MAPGIYSSVNLLQVEKESQQSVGYMTWKEHFDREIVWINKFHDEREKRYQERFTGQEEAIRVADKRLEEYKSQANEWRGQSKDRERDFLPIATHATFAKSMDEKFALIQTTLKELITSGSRVQGKSEGVSATWAVVTTIIGIVLGAIGLIAGLMIN